MKLRALCLVALLFLVAVGSVSAAPIILKRLPDLVAQINQLGPPAVNASGSVEVPVRVIVTNQGNAAAGIFKVSTEYAGPTGVYYVAFRVPGQGTYPFTSAPLNRGTRLAFSGRVIFIPSVRGVTVQLTAIADSISGDEFLPAYGRVRERDETNNKSVPLSIALP